MEEKNFMIRTKVLVLASGGKNSNEGGSGFKVMAQYFKHSDVEIVAVVSNYENGGVEEKAKELGITFEYWPGPFDAQGYQFLVKKYQADYVMLSGWLKMVHGLDPAKTVNIHPGPLPEFGGKNMYGHHVHEAVLAAYKKGEITHTAVTMHFVTEEYDLGPICFAYLVEIFPTDDADSIQKRVNISEHYWQSRVLYLIVHDDIKYLNSKAVYFSPKAKEELGMFIPEQ